MFSQPIGPIQSSTVSFGSAVSLTTTVPANITSVAVSAGTYLVNGSVASSAGAGAVVTGYQAGISSTSATVNFPGAVQSFITYPTATNEAFTTPARIIVLTNPGTIYLVARADFTGGSLSIYGELFITRLF